MPILKIEGVPPLDGEYPADLSTFTNRELHLIKVESGLRAGEIPEAFEAEDSDLAVALAMIMIQRAGRGEPGVTRDLLWDAPANSAITFAPDKAEVEPEKEDESLPPPSEPDASGSDVGRKPLSGSGSVNGGESRASSPSPTGVPI